MRIYDDLLPVIAPYLSFTTRPRFRSAAVNTDEVGFRLSHGRQAPVDSTTWWQHDRRGVVLGSSFAFGVGATGDASTLVSALNVLQERTFLNLGIRAGNSTQELIASIPYLADAETVVVCSGLNNLVANLQSAGRNRLFGPLFFEDHYETLAQHALTELSTLVKSSFDHMGFRVLAAVAMSRLSRRWRSPRGHATVDVTHPQASPVAESRAAAARSLEIQARDLTMIRRSLRPRAALLFVAHPFAETVTKQFTPEEEELFRITDDLQDDRWQAVKDRTRELWPGYVDELRAVCAREDIPFLDLAKTPYEGWCFVDRVHMSDHGYRQTARAIAGALS